MWPITEEVYSNVFKNPLEKKIEILNKFDTKNLNDVQYSAFVHLRSSIYELINLYGIHTNTKYNPNKVKDISELLVDTNILPDNRVTVIMTTCKRYDLFERTINSFLDCCLDLKDYLYDYIIIDDQSSTEDINKMRKNYPFITIIEKPQEKKGHAHSMNMLVDIIKTDYFIILEDDWEFVVKDNFITKAFEVFKEGSSPSKEGSSPSKDKHTIGQVLFNMNYAEDLTMGPNINSSERFYTKNNLCYLVHSFKPKEKFDYPNCHYWPHFSFRVGLTRTQVLKDVGEFITKPIHFEMEYAYRYTEKNYKTAFLDSIVAYHTGRRTYERDNKTKQNAYDLNSESQFGEPVKDRLEENTKSLTENNCEENIIGVFNDKPIVSKSQFNIKSYVINLERRPTRLYKFFNRFPLSNYVHIFDGIDGKKLKADQKLERLFSTGDFNYRRGIVGCALSHITIWQEIINNAMLDYILIFEDDAVPVFDFNTKLIHLLNQYHGKFDVLYLGMFPYPNKDKSEWHYNSKNYKELPCARQLNKSDCFEVSMGGNHGYIMSRKGVLNCLEYINKHGMTNAIDWMVMHTANINRVYYSFPFIIEGDCYQTSNKNNYQTDIQLDYESVKFNKEEFFNTELKYWRSKCLDKLRVVFDNNLDEILKDLYKTVTIVKNDQKIVDFISNKPFKYYNVEDWIIVVPEILLTKTILEEKTFDGYLNKVKPYSENVEQKTDINEPIKKTITKKFEKTLLVAVMTKNVIQHISKVLNNVEKYISYFSDYRVCIVDGYSKDGTEKVCLNWCKDDDKKELISQVNRGLNRPLGLEEARNIYIEHFEEYFNNEETYLLCIDGDEVNASDFNEEGFLSNFLYKDWDAMFCNQSKIYYDIWALRKEDCDYDCWEMYKKTGDMNYVNKHHKHIDPKDPLIPCKSAFGGTAIYKCEKLKGIKYKSFVNNKEVCEHVPFNTALSDKGGKLYINPAFINI